MSGANISDPAAAAGTTLPSIAGFLGGPPHATYPFWLSDAVIPQTLSLYPGNSFARLRQNALCARVATTEFSNQSMTAGRSLGLRAVSGGPQSRRPRKSTHACEYWCTKSGSGPLTQANRSKDITGRDHALQDVARIDSIGGPTPR